MPHGSKVKYLAMLALTLPAFLSVGQGAARAGNADDQNAPAATVVAPPKPDLDRSGRKRTGKASFYAKRFAGKKMADGTRMEPNGDSAASKTLPLGTTAKITNLDTGRTAVVTIRDRGPFVKDRILDVSPATAGEIGLDKKDGVARVSVTPITEPTPGSTAKP